MRKAWDQFWFRDASPLGVRAARVLLAGNALWILLSRPDLHEIAGWPGAFWRHVDPRLKFRFLIFDLDPSIETWLFHLLLVSLAAAVAGLAPRLACLSSGILLYHFAPFEDVFASVGGPFFRGLTVPVSGLLILAFAHSPRPNDRPSAEFRWPLKAIQLLFAFTYLFSGIAKLRAVGPSWMTGKNFEGLVLGLVFPDVRHPLAYWFVDQPFMAWLGAVAGMTMDLLFIAAVFSRRAARWIVPIVAAIHLMIVPVMGVVFLNVPLLLLFVNWDWIAQRFRRPRVAPGPSGRATSAPEVP